MAAERQEEHGMVQVSECMKNQIAATTRRSAPDISCTEFLDCDPCPNLIVDEEDACQIVYTNDAFQQWWQTVESDIGPQQIFFSNLVLGHVAGLHREPFVFGERRWIARRLKRHSLVLVTCQDIAHTLQHAPESRAQTPSPDARLVDWTRFEVSGLSQHVLMVKSYPWHTTCLGPMDTWSVTLCQLVTSVMTNPDPRLILWGPDNIMIYNEACAAVIGQKHPRAVGALASDVWSEVWAAFEPMIDNAKKEGKAKMIPRMPLTMQHHGFEEETHWRVNLVPIMEANGHCAGVVDEFYECTKEIVQNRRRGIVVSLNERISHVDSLEQVWQTFLEGAESAVEDIPYAMVYTPTGSTHQNPAGVNTPSRPLHQFSMTGHVGISPKDTELPLAFDLQSSTAAPDLIMAFRRAWQTGKTVILQSGDDTIPSQLALRVPSRSAESEVRTAFIVPIPDLFHDHQLAFLVIGLTPRRPLDTDAIALVDYLGDLVAKSACTIFLPEGQRRAQQRFEEIEMNLSQQLRATSLQAERIEARYASMFQMAPVGMYAITPDSKHTVFNDRYLEITGIPRSVAEDRYLVAEQWIHDDDVQQVLERWTQCYVDKQPFSVEYRMKKEWYGTHPATGEKVTGDTWVYATAAPEFDDAGNIVQIMGWLLDISERKYHEKIHQARTDTERAEERFKRLAESAPLGMYLLKPDGTPLYLNDAYFEIIGFSKEEFAKAQESGVGWADQILEEDIPRVTEAWLQLSQHGIPLNLEYRVKKMWKSWDPATNTEMTGPTWLQGTAVAERDEHGNMIAVQGFVTEISSKKFSERLLADRLEEALATKQQADRFIDMTSHEMRNPLSAILQSADGILTAHAAETAEKIIGEHTTSISSSSWETVIDSAQTIILCAQHQKRIVDDILTLSKLDSNLLVISPDKTCPPELIRRCFKMYEGEIERADIDVSLRVQQSYHDLRIHNVMLDSSRVLQVVINLLTNAVKFTQHATHRQIIVSLGASLQRPQTSDSNTAFVPPRASRADPTEGPEWGDGEEVYLTIAVEDSGRGLTDEELKLMFHRFSQASPKTYKQYGGSGLGLFISRELTELQGGQIGVSSIPTKGTTFTFYVKAKRHNNDSSADHNERFETLRASSVPTLRSPLHSGSPVTPTFPQRRSSLMHRRMSPVRDAWTDGPSKLNVLVVEDNVINQRVMATQLRRLGCVVHVANHGVEALSFLERSTFWNSEKLGLPDTPMSAEMILPIPLSVILMDVEMPVLGGLECVKRIRELERSGTLKTHVPVIAITANARSEQINTAIEHGMDSVVTKPFRIPDLLPQMNELVAKLGHR